MAIAPPQANGLSPGPRRPRRYRVPHAAHQRPERGRHRGEPAVSRWRRPPPASRQRRRQRPQPARDRARPSESAKAKIWLWRRAARTAAEQVLHLLARVRVVAVRQHHLDARRQNARRNVRGRARHHDQLVIGVIQRGQSRQVLAQSFVFALDRHDDGGGRQFFEAALGQPRRHVIRPLALAPQREPRQQQRRPDEEPVPEHQT